MDTNGIEKLLKLYIEEKKKVLDNFPIRDVAEVAELVWKAYLGKKTIYACGNGGNAAYVANLITDFANHPFVSDDKNKTLPGNVPRLTTFDLCASSASVTGIMNDLGPERIFAQQLINDSIAEGDLVFGFTGSGNSKNVLAAFEVAERYGAKTIAITRGTGEKSKEVADYCIIIPGTSTFPGQTGGNDNNFHYEDATSAIAHMITGIMRERIWEKYGNGS